MTIQTNLNDRKGLARRLIPFNHNEKLRYTGTPAFAYDHAFELQRQLRYSRLPSQSEFFVISKHFTATRRIPPTSCALKSHSSRCNAQVEPRHFTTRL